MRHFSKTFLALGLSLAVAVVGCKSVFEDNDYAYDKNAQRKHTLEKVSQQAAPVIPEKPRIKKNEMER